MMVLDSGANAPDKAVRSESEAGVVRIVIGGVLSDAASAVAREMLLEACERGVQGVVLTVEGGLDPANPDALRHLMDVAQRSCWTVSCRLEVTATDPDVCEALVAGGIWPTATRP